MSTLEIFANLFTVACIFLAGRNHILTWPVGIVACVLFGKLFYDASLYADVTLQIFFIITSVYGFIIWKKNNGTEQETQGIKKASFKNIALIYLSAFIVAIAYGLLLKNFTDAFAPYIDSMVLTLSVGAQILLMKRYIDTWPAWIVVNTLSVPLFFSRELYLTASLYAVFWVHAFYAWYVWKQKFNKQNKE